MNYVVEDQGSVTRTFETLDSSTLVKGSVTESVVKKKPLIW